MIYDNKTTKIPLYGKKARWTKQRNYKKLTIENKDIELQWGSKEFVLPFLILLNDFILKRYPGSNSPSEFSSDIKVYDKQENHSL